MLDALRAGLATVGASDQLSLWARDGIRQELFLNSLNEYKHVVLKMPTILYVFPWYRIITAQLVL